MDILALRKLVRQGESLHLEFKLKASHPEKIMKEIVAFANTEGGTLLVGISDDCQVRGLKFPDEEEYILRQAIEKYCAPPIAYLLERLPIEEDSEREVLIFTIEASKEAPHAVITQGGEKKVYVRVGDRSIQASKEMKEILKQMRKQKNIRFHYGDKERVLMKYLAENESITLDKFAEIAQVTRKVASRTLILLVLANVLKILPEEMQDYFAANAVQAENR